MILDVVYNGGRPYPQTKTVVYCKAQLTDHKGTIIWECEHLHSDTDVHSASYFAAQCAKERAARMQEAETE